MNQPTLKDIAKALDISVSTVSRAMTDAADINKETKERILKKARELGYRPNPIARSLHNKKSFQIGVIVPELYSDFFPEVIKGIEEMVRPLGYQLLIMQSNENVNNELENVKRLEQHWVDGLIISLSGEGENIAYYNERYSAGMPMVFFNRANEKLQAPKVLFNDFKWSCLIVEHLIRQGHKEIYHLAGYKHLSLARDRIRGYEKAMNKFHLEYDDSYIIETGFNKEDGQYIMHQILKKSIKPDALFAVNDEVAIGAMRSIKEAGLKIPDDVAMVGFTESRLADYIDPPLTSVKQPALEIGRKSASNLLEQIEGNKKDVPKEVILEGHINLRESSRRI